jgi:hypothetical protein
MATQDGVSGSAQLTVTPVAQSVQGRLIFGSDYISGLYELDASGAKISLRSMGNDSRGHFPL